MPILLGVGAAALVLIGLVVGGIILIAVNMSGSSKQEVAAANESSALPVAGRADPAPLVANEQPAVPVKNKVDTPPAPVAVPANDPPARPAKGNEAAIPPGPVPAEMAADVIKKVKHSTVYLRISLPNGEIAQGSGFFALERGIVITNAHVVGMKRSDNPPRSVEVIVHSGETDEAKLAGTPLGLDRDNDLAVLRVQGDLSRLPPPLPVATAAALTETQTVYIFGFPFGAQLGKNITVSKSAISSLRRGDNGVLQKVQVNGGMHPGNSGGPVTDARGVVIGVSVAGISGTQINFAVPGDFIPQLVDRSKKNPLDLTPRPAPLAKNEPPAGQPVAPPPGAGLEGDLAALRGTWQSGPVGADGGGAAGTVKLSISPQPGSRGGRLRLEIATKQGGRTTSSTSNYSFTLEQKGNERILVTAIRRGARGTVRGMVFIYRFEGGQLILTGAIASARIAYTLKNVALRRTAAEPEMAGDGNPAAPAPGTPAAGGKGKGLTAGLKISGDVYALVAEAVRDKRLADVDIRGFTLHKDTYRDVCEEGGVLIGFQFGLGKFAANDIVNALRPIYLTKSGEKFGNWHGPAPAAPLTVKAKPGYVVSAISVRTALSLDSLRLTFAKLGKDGLDLSDTYNSEQVGGNGGRPSEIDGKGALFVGATGHIGPDKSPSSLGLVAVLPKN
jgi:S1-C subfamily serine protease